MFGRWRGRYQAGDVRRHGDVTLGEGQTVLHFSGTHQEGRRIAGRGIRGNISGSAFGQGGSARVNYQVGVGASGDAQELQRRLGELDDLLTRYAAVNGIGQLVSRLPT